MRREAVLRKIEVAENPLGHVTHMLRNRCAKTAVKLVACGETTTVFSRFQDEHALPPLGEVPRAHQTIVSRTNDDCVVAGHSRDRSASQKFETILAIASLLLSLYALMLFVRGESPKVRKLPYWRVNNILRL